MKRTAAIERLLDKQGRLRAWPARADLRDGVRSYLVDNFDLGHIYTEREVNDLLTGLHSFDDHALVRREFEPFCWRP